MLAAATPLGKPAVTLLWFVTREKRPWNSLVVLHRRTSITETGVDLASREDKLGVDLEGCKVLDLKEF